MLIAAFVQRSMDSQTAHVSQVIFASFLCTCSPVICGDAVLVQKEDLNAFAGRFCKVWSKKRVDVSNFQDVELNRSSNNMYYIDVVPAIMVTGGAKKRNKRR